MIRLCTPLIALSAALLMVQPLLAEDGPYGRGDDHRQEWAPEFGTLEDNEYRLIPLHRAVKIATARYEGRIIAAQLTGPTPFERDRGVVLVHELRLLTPARDVLRIRLDARDGAFLEVAGAGLSKARRKGNTP
jgi:uncharacterized membrane protein YkoI